MTGAPAIPTADQKVPSASPQMLRRYGASARSARARRTYDAS